MEHDRQVAFRLSSSLVEEIDARAEEWRANAPGMRVTRADVVRAILVQALESDEIQRLEALSECRVVEKVAPLMTETTAQASQQSQEPSHKDSLAQTGLQWRML